MFGLGLVARITALLGIHAPAPPPLPASLSEKGRALQERVESFGEWYHRIDLGDGVITPGVHNQALTFALYERLLGDLTGKTVLDLGANACGLSIEFAKRGAHVTAIERAEQYVEQARFIIDHFGLAERITLKKADVHEVLELGQFDIVACVGLIYHLRHPQLALDQLSHVTKSKLLISSQTTPENALTLTSRGQTQNRGRFSATWEPTERALAGMIDAAGFRKVKLLSTAPHAGESADNVLGNRSYFIADFGKAAPLPNLNSVAAQLPN